LLDLLNRDQIIAAETRVFRQKNRAEPAAADLLANRITPVKFFSVRQHNETIQNSKFKIKNERKFSQF
jgi:hypothetical protein